MQAGTKAPRGMVDVPERKLVLKNTFFEVVDVGITRPRAATDSAILVGGIGFGIGCKQDQQADLDLHTCEEKCDNFLVGEGDIHGEVVQQASPVRGRIFQDHAVASSAKNIALGSGVEDNVQAALLTQQQVKQALPPQADSRFAFQGDGRGGRAQRGRRGIPHQAAAEVATTSRSSTEPRMEATMLMSTATSISGSGLSAASTGLDASALWHPPVVGSTSAFADAAHNQNLATNSSQPLPQTNSASVPSCPDVNPTSSSVLSAFYTTVMLRNLPNKYTRSMLIDLLISEGFGGKFHFVYLPVDFKTQAGLGYAFVDLITPYDAECVRRHFEGFSRWTMPSDKIMTVSWSHPAQQGMAVHVDRYRNSPVMHETMPDEWKPALFVNGERVPFPLPTRKVKQPRAMGTSTSAVWDK